MNVDQSPILITGIPRSGASMIAGVINLCGAFGGDMTYRKGTYENGAIQRFIEDGFLQSMGADPSGQFPLPVVESIPVNWRKLVESQLLVEGYISGYWMYKSSRASLIWQIWHSAFPDAKWVIVRRRTADVIQSCIKTGYMKAFKDENNLKLVQAITESEGWLWMVHKYEEKFVEMITEGLNCKVVWPERMVTGDYKQIYETIEWLGLDWKSDALNFVDPLLWGSRQKQKRRAS